MSLFGERRRRASPRIEIIPMVDVMFLLLVFYILSSLALTQQQGIPVQLPEATTGESIGRDEVVVSIDREGRFSLNKKAVAAEVLAEEVQALAVDYPGGLEALRQGEVVLQADLEVPHRLVVQAIDELRTIGINRFAIAIDPEQGASSR